MAYTPTIPAQDNNPSADQPLMKDNFAAIATVVNLNHVNFNDPEEGKHKFLQMPEQSSAPTTALNEAGFYSRKSSLTSQTELVFRRESNGEEIEFSGLLDAEEGWTRLPSGILLKWGVFTITGVEPKNLPVATNIPAFTDVFNIQISVIILTGQDLDRAVTLQNFSTTSIDAYASKRTETDFITCTYKYLIIGL